MMGADLWSNEFADKNSWTSLCLIFKYLKITRGEEHSQSVQLHPGFSAHFASCITRRCSLPTCGGCGEGSWPTSEFLRREVHLLCLLGAYSLMEVWGRWSTVWCIYRKRIKGLAILEGIHTYNLSCQMIRMRSSYEAKKPSWVAWWLSW